MTIRYELDTSGPLHKIVKVVDATLPLLDAPLPPAQPVTLGEASAYISAVAAGLRADTKRTRRWGFNGVAVPKQRDPQRDLPGEDLLKARKAAGLSQRQLAEEWGLSRGLIGTIELGHRSCPPELAAWARRINAQGPEA